MSSRVGNGENSLVSLTGSQLCVCYRAKNIHNTDQLTPMAGVLLLISQVLPWGDLQFG